MNECGINVDLFAAALKHHQEGRLQEAEAGYLKLLDTVPSHYGALANLGALYAQQSQPGSAKFMQAINCFEKSLVLFEHQPNVHNNLGNAYVALGLLDKSDAHYQAAISAAPNYLDAYINRALLLKKTQGCMAAQAWLNSFSDAFDQLPGFLICRGAFSLELGENQAALDDFDRVISLNPGEVVAWYNRGNVLRLMHRLDESLTSYRRCLKLNPRHVEALINSGVLYQDLKCFNEAIACYDAALRLRPDAISAHYNRALALENTGRFDEAVAGFETTLAMSPAYPYLVGRLHHARMQCCDWSGYDQNVELICNAVTHGLPTALPFIFLAISDDLRLQRLCAENFTRDKFPALPVSHFEPRYGLKDRTRVGYFSADFRTHAVGFLTAGLFESHDRSKFEVFAFSLGRAPEGDVYRDRIASGVEHFVEVSAKTDDEIVDLARSLELDVAVDLVGHTMDARTGIFVQRVAPVQVNYLGYPGTMGAPYIDVILADDITLPMAAASQYCERVIRLPETFQINDDQRRIGVSGSRAAYGLPDAGLVLASFNTSYKINPPLFDIWCRLLLAAPEGSVLWLLGENPVQIQNLRAAALSRGVAAERLVFGSRMSYPDHLARYGHVDLVLDTFPFNGGTSTSDALWGGAPVLTCSGQSYASRMSASLLAAVGLPELMTESLSAYEALGLSLVGEKGRLEMLRARLDQNLKNSVLFNTGLQTRALESAYLSVRAGLH